MSITEQLFNIANKTTSKAYEYWQSVPEKTRQTWQIRAFGLSKIPMMAFTNPTVVDINDEKLEVKIPLNFRTQNHWKSLYFGALAVGADAAVGMLAMRIMETRGAKVSLIFKDFKAEYFKRADGDTHFICDRGAEIDELITEALTTGERVNKTIEAYATVPSKYGDEPVAKFGLTLSLKKRA